MSKNYNENIFFYNSINDMTNIAIGQSRDLKNDFNIFAKGYHYIASTSIDNLLNTTSISDYKFYPCFYLYRHSLELYLKSIIYNTKALRTLENCNLKIDDFYNNHNLSSLSKISIKILNSLFPEQINDLINKLQKITTEFDYIDKSSLAFRYPINKNGEPSTPVRIINATSFSNFMNELLNELDDVIFGLNMETDIRIEQTL